MKEIKFNLINRNLKTCWEDITIKDYYSITDDSSKINCLSVLLGVPKEEIKNAPNSVIESIIEESRWFWESKILEKTSNEFGNKLLAIEQMKFGQFAEAEIYAKSKKKLHKFIAVFLKPGNQTYTEYCDYGFKENCELVLNKSILEALGVLNFFLLIQKRSEKNEAKRIKVLANYLKKAKQMKKMELKQNRKGGLISLLSYQITILRLWMISGIKTTLLSYLYSRMFSMKTQKN